MNWFGVVSADHDDERSSQAGSQTGSRSGARRSRKNPSTDEPVAAASGSLVIREAEMVTSSQLPDGTLTQTFTESQVQSQSSMVIETSSTTTLITRETSTGSAASAARGAAAGDTAAVIPAADSASSSKDVAVDQTQKRRGRPPRAKPQVCNQLDYPCVLRLCACMHVCTYRHVCLCVCV